jgi:hypothetical protein
MRRTWAAAVIFLAGCSASLPLGTPRDPAAVFRPAAIVPDRETLAPGDVVTLDFPGEDIVGVGYALEQEVGSTWVYRYLLNAPGGVGEPGWQVAEEGLEVPAIGISDPVRVAIPEVAEPGSWRICTILGAGNICVRIEIVDG